MDERACAGDWEDFDNLIDSDFDDLSFSSVNADKDTGGGKVSPMQSKEVKCIKCKNVLPESTIFNFDKCDYKNKSKDNLYNHKMLKHEQLQS